MKGGWNIDSRTTLPTEFGSLVLASIEDNTDGDPYEVVVVNHDDMDVQYIFPIEQFKDIVTTNFSFKGTGGICDHCTDGIDDAAIILETELTIHTFHESCYDTCYNFWKDAYESHLPEITSHQI